MTTDTSRTIEISGSPAKLVGLVAIGIVLTAASVAMAVPLLPDSEGRIDLQVIGWAGVIFFGLCTVVAIVRLFRARRPVITISPEGIRDVRIARDLISWSDITGLSTREYVNQKVMVLAVAPAAQAKLRLTPMARWTRGADQALGADGLCITAAGLKIDYPTLLRMGTDYRNAAQARP